MEIYQYSPISQLGDEVRLLDLSPCAGLSETVLEGTLRTIKVSDLGQAKYETISYCWGNSDTCQKVIIDGKILPITQNAHLALRRVVYTDKPRTLWLDSIAINQADIAERTQQILLMGQVYSCSQANLIHLVEGEGDPRIVDRAIDNLLVIDEEINSLSDSDESFKDMVQPGMAWEFALSPAKTELDIDALVHLFYTAWFRRVWVVQEAVLAHVNECYFGHRLVALDKVLRVAVFLYHYHGIHIPRILYEAAGLENASVIWELRRSRKPNPTSLLYHSSELEATDLRDKVFGMLGLLVPPNASVPALLRPDYAKSVAHVFRDATRNAIENLQHLYILRFLSHRTEEDIRADGFPSWVPRFDRARAHDKDPAIIHDSYRHPTGVWRTGDVNLGRDADDMNVLRLHGIVVDEVGSTMSPIFKEDETKLFWMSVLRLLEMKEQYKLRFAKVLTAEMDFRHKRIRDGDLAGFELWLARIKEGPLTGITRLPKDADANLTRATNWNQAMMNAINHRRWACPKGDLMALVPRTTKPGDVFVVVAAASVPYVLRPLGNGEYLMLGECYLENNMDGQALEVQKEKGIPDQIFRIR